MHFGNGVVGNPLCPHCGSSLIPGGPRAAEPLLLKAPTSHLGVLQKKKKKHLQAKSLAYVALQLTRNS